MTAVIFMEFPVSCFPTVPALTALIAATGLAACNAASLPAERLDIRVDGGIRSEAVGVWVSQESGWILDITPDGLTRWQDTPAGCYRSAQDGPTLMSRIEYRYITPQGHDRARFEYLPSDGHADFERIAALPERCDRFDLSSPQAEFDVFTGIFSQHYAFFERRGVDWEGQVEALRPAIHDEMSDTELFEALSSLIAPMGDSHTKLIGTVDGEARRFQTGLGETLPMIRNGMGETPWLIGLIDQLMTGILDPGAVHTANDRIIRGTIDGRVGYLQIFTMGGFVNTEAPGTPEWAEAELAELENQLDAALTEFAGLDAVILDLSNNRGGYDAVTRAIAARFTDTPYTGYTVRTDWDGPVQAVYEIAPHDGPRFSGPVYVLTSDVTVSGGEITTMMLRQLPHVVQAGSTTRGAFSTPLAKPLPNGWYLELSNEIFADASGRVHEGTGLVPDMPLAVYAPHDPVASHAAAIRAIVERIESEA